MGLDQTTSTEASKSGSTVVVVVVVVFRKKRNPGSTGQSLMFESTHDRIYHYLKKFSYFQDKSK